MEEQNTTTEPAQDQAADIENNRVLGILAYILFIIPLLAAKDSKFAMYHANQGLSLFVVAVASHVILAFVPFFGALLSGLASLAVLALMVIGIIGASKGEMKPLPVIGGLSLLK
ncbi:MAG: hypothetical protein AB1734_10695 [Elusimicrobiota bacterium]